MDFWVNILEILRNGKTAVLLQVIHSEGSSPGRAGFHLVVDNDGNMKGSIGGGIMEYKLVEKAKKMLISGRFLPFIQEQVHSAEGGRNRSGMICSGKQTIAFYFLSQKEVPCIQGVVESLSNNLRVRLHFSDQGIALIGSDEDVHQEELAQWSYIKEVGFDQTLYIIGGGHVGLALSEIMNKLGFYIILIDDRADLNTVVNNSFANKKLTVSYDELRNTIEQGDNVYVAIMTFGYRTDEVCIKQLIDLDFNYLGVMGSSEKMTKLLASLREQRYSAAQLAKLHTPIGLPINSKTPMEIAISVAAEIISIKNASN